MSLREGSCATFVGVASPIAEVGDRCLVLSYEGTFSNVRWVTGSKETSYDMVPNADLVPDQRVKVSAFDDDDQFGFEAPAPKAVRVATAAVHTSGGNAALMHALRHEGLVTKAVDAALQAVSAMRASLMSDRGWREVVSDLGDDGPDFLRYAMSELVTKALNEVGEHGI